MRAVVTRVTEASVAIGGEVRAKIGRGLCVLLGVHVSDTEAEAAWVADRICRMRIFEDENGKMNISPKDAGAEILIVSQFTLYGDCRKGKRPSFTSAMEPAAAERMYEDFIRRMESEGIRTEHGSFGADMKVELLNDGPVTLLLDSSKIL